MRAQVLVDGKNFSAAIMDYNEAMSRTSGVLPYHTAPPVQSSELPAVPLSGTTEHLNMLQRRTLFPRQGC